MRQKPSPRELLLANEIQLRREIADGESFALDKLLYLRSVSKHRILDDPTDVSQQTPMSIRLSGNRKSIEESHSRAIGRARSLVEEMRRKVASTRSKSDNKEVTRLARRPSQYEVLMKKAMSFQRVAQQILDSDKDERNKRAIVEAEQFDCRRAILKIKVRDLGQLAKLQV